MSSTRKRITTLLMALVMLMSVLPMSAFTGREEAAGDKAIVEDQLEAGVYYDGDGAYEISDDVDLSVVIGGTTVKIVDNEGALEKGTHLKVRQLHGVKAAAYLDAIEADGTELSDPLVLDISLIGKNGKERQPKNGKSVELYFENEDYDENTMVWHFEDDEAEEAEPSRGGAKGPAKAPGKSGAKGAAKAFEPLENHSKGKGAAKVSAGHFSVYVVDGTPENARAKVIFHQYGDETETIWVKKSDRYRRAPRPQSRNAHH